MTSLDVDYVEHFIEIEPNTTAVWQRRFCQETSEIFDDYYNRDITRVTKVVLPAWRLPCARWCVYFPRRYGRCMLNCTATSLTSSSSSRRSSPLRCQHALMTRVLKTRATLNKRSRGRGDWWEYYSSRPLLLSGRGGAEKNSSNLVREQRTR